MPTIRYTIAVILLMLLQPCGRILAQNTWNKVYDFCPDTNRASNNVAQYADDNAIIVAGHIQNNSQTRHICYIASMDYYGHIIGSRNLESVGKINMMGCGFFDKLGYPLIKVASNKYLLCGAEMDTKINTLKEVYQPFFYFFNQNCDSLLQVKYTDTIISRIPYSVIQDKQGNLIVAGQESSRKLRYDAWSQSYFWDSMYVWLAKYDANANLVWSKKLLGGDNHGTNQSAPGEAHKIILGHSGQSYIISGSALNSAKNTSGLFIMKTDLDGNMLWLNFLPKEYEAWGQLDITPLQNGSYGFVATIGGPVKYDTYTYYGAFDEYGDTLWTKRFRMFNGDITGQQICMAENGDLLIHSYVYHYKHTHGILRTTPTGNIKWYREYMYADTSYFNHKFSAMSYTPTRQVLLSGYFSSPQAVPGVFDTAGLYSWFVLTDTFGCIEPGCQVGDTVWWLTDVNETAAKPLEINIYPNPATDILNIHIAGLKEKITAELYDITGRRILNTSLQPNGQSAINIGALAPGSYILKLYKDGAAMTVRRITKQ